MASEIPVLENQRPLKACVSKTVASVSRFVPLKLALDDFIEKQAKNKTNGDVALFKEFLTFLRTKEIDEKMDEAWKRKNSMKFCVHS